MRTNNLVAATPKPQRIGTADSGVLTSIYLPTSRAAITAEFYDGDPAAEGVLILTYHSETGEPEDLLEPFESGLWAVVRSFHSFIALVDVGCFYDQA